MPNENAARARLFSPEHRNRILSLAMGKPTGVRVEIAGVDFDLYPISFNEIKSVLSTVGKVSRILQSARKGADQASTGAELAEIISSDGDQLLEMIHKMLRRAAHLDGDAEKQNFDDWFNELPAIEVVKTLVPKVLEANGVSQVFNRPQAAATESAP